MPLEFSLLEFCFSFGSTGVMLLLFQSLLVKHARRLARQKSTSENYE